ncbi:MAG: tetratricopeptide repeat protein, partial [Spirosomaceae bacterium]|nr:tetratricopeptide repeat protein [Spirosomataceae bacterium]
MKYLFSILFVAFLSIAVQAQRTVPTTYDSLNTFLKTQPKDTLYVWALRPYTLKVIYEKADYKKADSLVSVVKQLSEKLDYGRGLYFHYLLKAIVHNQKSEYAEELKNYQKSLEIIEKYKLNNYLREAALSNIGVAYRNLGNNEKAMEYALKAIEIQEKNNFPIKFLDAGPYGLVAGVLKNYKKPKEAIKYAEKALEIAEKKQDIQKIGIQENRLGNLYDDMNEEEKALKHYLRGLEYARKSNYLLLQTDLLSNVGRTYANLGDSKKGEPFLLENEKICRQLESPVALQTALSVLGEFYQEQKDFTKAQKYLTEAYELNKKVDDITEKIYSTETLSDFFAKINNHKKAFELMKEANALKDSSAALQSEELSRDLLAKYETEKKETQIKLLNEEAQNANFQRNAFLVGGVLGVLLAGLAIFSISNRNKLKRLEEEQRLRNRIAADLHDEIGSTLSSISILSEIVAFQQKKGEFKPEIMQQVSNDARDVIEKMDDIIWTINPSNDAFNNLETRLKTFAIPLFESKDIDFKFAFDAELENVKINMGKRRDIYLILKEAINNLVKYSQCQNAVIAAQADGLQISFLIKDDGVGFDTNAESFRNGQRNMKMRAEKIGADLVINSEIGKGT